VIDTRREENTRIISPEMPLICLVPLAGFPAADPLAVRAGAGVAGLALEVGEARADRLVDHRVYLGDQVRPVPLPCLVSGLAGQARVLAEGGVEDGD
jgi:hypothetical protein